MFVSIKKACNMSATLKEFSFCSNSNKKQLQNQITFCSKAYHSLKRLSTVDREQQKHNICT